MIETVEALGNVEKIAATEGLTGIYIGPSDLSISMGYKPGLDRTGSRQGCKELN
jgi:4-hydroxy-2-oxoheptanedioate aldolase